MTDDLLPKTAAEPMVEAVFRNGAITAFGITVSFSLGFLSQWASSPGVWRVFDIPPVVTLFAGIVCQIRAVSLLLPVEGLRKIVYDKATRIFMIGLILAGIGVFGAVSLDALSAVFPYLRSAV
jgi:hypothetical protein